MRMRKSVEPVWSDRDSALWYTCEIAVDLAAGQMPPPQLRVMSTFPPQLGPDEQFFARGPFVLYEERALGDGTYLRDSGFFFATGRGGLTATAAVAAFRSAGNTRRRREAERAAIPRWVPISQGLLYVSQMGMHLHGSTSLISWPWGAINAAEMVGPGAMHMFGASTQGPVCWIVQSDWAELIFVAWALARHRQHPQLIDGSWLPPGWLQWCASQSHPSRLRTGVLPD